MKEFVRAHFRTCKLMGITGDEKQFFSLVVGFGTLPLTTYLEKTHFRSFGCLIRKFRNPWEMRVCASVSDSCTHWLLFA